MKDLWEQRADESAKAFHAFVHYRDLDPGARSIEAAHAEHRSACLDQHQRRTNPAPSQWKLWSSKYGWVERARAYDRHCDELLRAGKERDLILAQDRWLHQARQLQALGFEALLGRDLSGEPVRELRLMVTEAARMEREALGFEASQGSSELQRGIQVWLDATRPSPEAVAALFADDDAAP